MFRQLVKPLGSFRCQPAALGRAQFVRGLKFNAKDYAPTQGFAVYSEELENAIAAQIQQTPDPTKAFKNAEGKALTPSDEQLKGAASLAALADVSRASFMDRLRLSNDQASVLETNSATLTEFFLNGRRILDKIPVEDPATGEITWTVIREGQKEGWENLMYYGYVPGLLIALGLYFFMNSDNLNDWAMEELRLRAQERHGAVEASSDKQKDELIVERILSGDYDKLAGLRKAGSELPSSLL